MKLSVTIILLVGLVALGCEKSSGVQPELVLNKTLMMKQSQSFQNRDSQLTLVMDSVLNESRCPIDAICVSAGNAEVRFTFTQDQNHITFSLNTDRAPVDTLAFGYRIELLDLTPIPVSTKRTQQNEYSGHVKVTKD